MREDFFIKISLGVIEKLEQEGRAGIFNSVLLPWLMINQKAGQLSLREALAQVRKGEYDHLLDSDSKRVRENNISGSTSGIVQARQRLPLKYVESLAQALTEGLLKQHDNLLSWHGKRVYLVDGTSCTLYPQKDLNLNFPPNKHPQSKSDWAKPKVVLINDLMTGIGLLPEFGAMYGEQAVSEVAMFVNALVRVEKNSVFVADQGFGILRVAEQSTKHKHKVLLRLTEQRADKFLPLLKVPGEVEVEWQPSDREKKKYPGISSVKGRFIWQKIKRHGRSIDLYIFTTLSESKKEIVRLYGRRWDVEQDIRSLKYTINLENIDVKTSDMFKKEMIMGILAYNLVRDGICQVAKRAKVDPRRLSFKGCLSILRNTFSGKRDDWMTPKELMDFFLSEVPFLINKKRKRPPQIRRIRFKRAKFPAFRGDRSDVKA